MGAGFWPLATVMAFGCACVATGGQEDVTGMTVLPEPADLPASREMPDPLVMFDGRRVTTRRQWERQRTPELRRLFAHYMYGVLPPRPRNQRATIEVDARDALDGRATLRVVTLRFGPDVTPPIHLLVLLPNDRHGPVPLFLGLTFVGNHAILADPRLPVSTAWAYPDDGRGKSAARGSARDVWNADLILSRGYGLATFYNGDVEPDHRGAPEGIRARYPRPPGTTAGRDDWGTIAAWAWGLQRALDYLVRQPEVDSKRICVVGHSRNGKAALLAAAFDPRIAMAIPLQAGCGGTAPSRGTVGESVRQINDAFPHWFTATFKQFNDQPERLPFDQNCLVALMAPRPVLFANATEDTWANPEGQFEVLRAADPVYRFLGVEGLATSRRPPEGQLVASRLGYFIRPGKHSMTRTDWEAFLDFADRHWGRRHR